MGLIQLFERRQSLVAIGFSMTIAGLSYNAGYNAGFMAHSRSTSRKLREETLPSKNDWGVDGLSLGSDHAFLWNGEKIFLETAKSLPAVTDKVVDHTYQVMYGMFLLPYYHQNPTMKVLEIGLGCGMGYGAGAAFKLHQSLFPKAELWEAEYLEDCVEKEKDKLKGMNILVGDQSDLDTLDKWIDQSGGNFDAIIDDGGHKNCEIWTSFQKLWPEVKSGGLYFVEDLQVAELEEFIDVSTPICDKTTIFPEKLKEFIDDLIYDKAPRRKSYARQTRSYEIERRKRPSDIKFIFCQSEACVLGKK